jgi:hypothetical protein
MSLSLAEQATWAGPCLARFGGFFKRIGFNEIKSFLLELALLIILVIELFKFVDYVIRR